MHLVAQRLARLRGLDQDAHGHRGRRVRLPGRSRSGPWGTSEQHREREAVRGSRGEGGTTHRAYDAFRPARIHRRAIPHRGASGLGVYRRPRGRSSAPRRLLPSPGSPRHPPSGGPPCPRPRRSIGRLERQLARPFEGRLREAVDLGEALRDLVERLESHLPDRLEAIGGAVLQVVVLGAGVEPRRLVAAEARVDERHHAAQADGRQRLMAGHGRLEAPAGREGVGTAEACGRAPELLAVDPMREKIASDVQVRVAHAVQDQRQADPGEHFLVVELLGQRAASKVAGGRDRNAVRRQGGLAVEEDEPGRVGQRIRSEHAGDLEQERGARATIVDAEKAEALVAPRVIGRDEQEDVGGAPGDLGGEVSSASGSSSCSLRRTVISCSMTSRPSFASSPRM